MTLPDPPQDFSGKLLIAMPGMGDPRFRRSVIYLCAHSEDGAMGLIVNRPAPEIRFRDLLGQLKIVETDATRAPAIYLGGPVENGRGFVLHSAEYAGSASTLQVDNRIGMTATLDVLEDIAKGTGPAACLLALGYSGWGPGQLEAEIGDNGWLVGDAPAELIFGAKADDKWRAALEVLGIDASSLSAASGRA